LLRILPFSALIGFLLFGSLVDSHMGLREFLGSWIVWSYLARTIVVMAILIVVWPHIEELKVEEMRAFFSAQIYSRWLLVICVGIAVFGIWVSVGPLLRIGSTSDVSVAPWPDESPAKQIWIMSRVFGAVLVVPVVEEVFWRSYLMRRLDQANFLALSPARTSTFSLISSSFVFALAHKEVLAGFITGMIYAQLYRQWGSIWPPVCAHAVTNLCLALYVLNTGKYEFW
jgi:uncharacterized protein